MYHHIYNLVSVDVRSVNDKGQWEEGVRSRRADHWHAICLHLLLILRPSIRWDGPWRHSHAQKVIGFDLAIRQGYESLRGDWSFRVACEVVG